MTSLIAVLPKNAREELRVSLAVYRGHHFADVRVYARRDDGETVPTPKGVAVKPAPLPALIEALRAALVALEASRDTRGAET